jgi:hypothetical protein
MEIDIYQLRGLLADAAELAIKRYRIEIVKEKPYLSEREAGRLYGSGVVKRWVKEELIRPIKDGNATSKKRYDSMKLEIIAKTSNRNTYLSILDHKLTKY